MNTTTNTRVSEAMVAHQAAAEALDSLDDYARMGIGVDAHGPRGMLERYIAQQAALSAEPAAQGDADFKNFHRLLCERFGYVHDPVDWKRDQLSLIEHIALTAPPAQPAERVPEGIVLVPRDPTEAQIKAMQSAWAKKEKDATPLRSTTAMVLYFAALAPLACARGWG